MTTVTAWGLPGADDGEGDVVGDGTFFNGPLLGDGWDPDDLNDWFAAPISGLSFNENVVTLRLVPVGDGLSPEVLTIPEAEAFVEQLHRAL